MAQQVSNQEYQKELLEYGCIRWTKYALLHYARATCPTPLYTDSTINTISYGMAKFHLIKHPTTKELNKAEHVIHRDCKPWLANAMTSKKSIYPYHVIWGFNKIAPNNISSREINDTPKTPCSWKHTAVYMAAQTGFNITSGLTYNAVERATNGHDGKRIIAHATTQTALDITNKTITDTYLEKPTGFYGIAADVAATCISGFIVNSIIAHMDKKQ